MGLRNWASRRTEERRRVSRRIAELGLVTVVSGAVAWLLQWANSEWWLLAWVLGPIALLEVFSRLSRIRQLRSVPRRVQERDWKRAIVIASSMTLLALIVTFQRQELRRGQAGVSYRHASHPPVLLDKLAIRSARWFSYDHGHTSVVYVPACGPACTPSDTAAPARERAAAQRAAFRLSLAGSVESIAGGRPAGIAIDFVLEEKSTEDASFVAQLRSVVAGTRPGAVDLQDDGSGLPSSPPSDVDSDGGGTPTVPAVFKTRGVPVFLAQDYTRPKHGADPGPDYNPMPMAELIQQATATAAEPVLEVGHIEFFGAADRTFLCLPISLGGGERGQALAYRAARLMVDKKLVPLFDPDDLPSPGTLIYPLPPRSYDGNWQASIQPHGSGAIHQHDSIDIAADLGSRFVIVAADPRPEPDDDGLAVGPIAQGEDLHRTPFFSEQQPGALIHAWAVESILSGQYLRIPSRPWSVFGLMLPLMVLGLYCTRDKWWQALVRTAVLLVGLFIIQLVVLHAGRLFIQQTELSLYVVFVGVCSAIVGFVGRDRDRVAPRTGGFQLADEPSEQPS